MVGTLRGVATAESSLPTREAILAAATTLFAERGFAGTSLNDIADVVGIRRPSVLHHFASKSALYQEVFTRAVTDFGVRVEEAVRGPREGWRLVDHVLEASFEFFVANPEFVLLVGRQAIEDPDQHGVDLGLGLRPYFQRAVRFFEREMAEGHFRRQDSEQMLLTGFAGIVGYFRDAAFIGALLGEDPLGERALRRRLDHMRDFFRAALAP